MIIPTNSKIDTILLNIRNQRMLKDCSEEYMAGKLGISLHEYSRIEEGQVAITLQMLILIADILEVELANLIVV